MASLADLLKSAAARLVKALDLEPREARLEAQILAAHALGVNRAWLVAHDRDGLPLDEANNVETLIARREKGEPVAYILGEREFYGRMFTVSPDVLIPRPETELLVEAALERLPKDRPARILDLGTGSGCIAISIALARPNCEVTAVDASLAALEVARLNAARLAAEGIRFQVSDWYARIDVKNFDIVVANPPYIVETDEHLRRGDLRSEPVSALAAGRDGLKDIRRIIAEAPSHLGATGWLLLEHGYDQASACADLLLAAGFTNIGCLQDFARLDRVSMGRLAG